MMATTAMVAAVLVVVLALSMTSAHAYDNGLALTPPMGWNTWNHFGCMINCTEYPTSCITEELIRANAKALKDSGMYTVGYEYVNLDDCWLATTRDSNGRLQPDPERFPSGIAALADYVHSLDLKFGIYEDVGNTTCAGFPGSLGNEELDAQTFADWGVDYVKLDGCDFPFQDMRAKYTQWTEAVNATGRPMVLSYSWPAYAEFNGQPLNSSGFAYIGSIANLWREYDDVRDKWDSWTDILDFQQSSGLAAYAAPGHFNDPDMLEIGNGNQTADEYRALFSLWSIIAAPLIAGNDLRNMTNSTIEILTNPEVIAVDQDPLCLEGKMVSSVGTSQVWARNLVGESVAVVLFNRDHFNNATISVAFADVGVAGRGLVRDLWAREWMGQFNTSYAAEVPPHGVVMITITPDNDEE